MMLRNHHRISPHRFRRRSRHHDVMERLAELLARDREYDPDWATAEDERLTQARLALFGCAPK